ncbi:MAG: hypothetical protein J6R96_04680 [Spirochaetaceae bacterium]|nr:hypothetical protein [Spirochaetaceae bacterium]
MLVSVPGGRNATDATIYTIELKGEKGSTYSKTVSAGQTAAFEELTPDVYAVVVKGSNDKNVVVYYGTASATVEAGKVASVKVELQDLLGKLTVDFSGADRAGDGMSFTVEVKSSNGISLSKPIVAGSSVSFEKLIPDTYGVTVKGSENGKVVYLGTSSAVFEVGQTSSVNVQLQNQFGELAVDFSGVDVDSTTKNFTVELHGSKDSIYTTTVPSGQTALFERLIPDTYSIEVDGRDEQGKIMLHGTNSVVVEAGKPIAVMVELQPQFGSLSVDFSDTTLASTGTSFSIELRGSKASIYHTTVPSGQIAQFEKLLPDTYVVTVKGTNENQIVVYSGTASAVVDAGESASITVELMKVAKIVTDAASFKEAIASGGTVYVVNDITVTESLIINQDVTIRALDKDVTLNYTGSSSVFTVENSATLTIGGGDYRLTVDGKGKTRSQPLLNITSGTVHLYGTITNGINDDSAGGIIVSGSASKLYMYEGATVSNCKCSNRWGRGGAISVKAYGCMFMSGGDITGNESTYCAAAVYVHDNGSLTMSGGTISKNTARGSDGGAAAVEISESSKFTQTGGAITGNSPKDIVNKSTLQ